LSKNQIELFVDNTYSVVKDFYVENAVWNLKGTEVTSADTRDRFSYYYDDYLMEVISLNLLLSRRPLYFMINGIFPCFILNLLTLITYPLPAAPQFTISWF
jgi:hypothetical protein